MANLNETHYQKEYYDNNKIKRKEYREKNMERDKEYQKKYRENNKEKQKKYHEKYCELNKEKQQTYFKEYYKKNRDKKKEYLKEYRKNNKEKILAKVYSYRNNRKKIDPLFKLMSNIKTMISKIISNKGYIKKDKTEQILGCSINEFKKYLESLWEPWMTWDNYGKYEKDKFNTGWDVDHIIPTSSAKTEVELYNLNHYTNLQPLCSKINRDIKRNFTS